MALTGIADPGYNARAKTVGWNAKSLAGRALAEELGDIEIDEISVMKDDRFD